MPKLPIQKLSSPGRMPSNFQCPRSADWSSSFAMTSLATGSGSGRLLGLLSPYASVWPPLTQINVRSSSYRELLGTAESIIQMNVQMQQVEAHLGDISIRCNGRLLGKSITNSALIDRDSNTRGRKRGLWQGRGLC